MHNIIHWSLDNTKVNESWHIIYSLYTRYKVCISKTLKLLIFTNDWFPVIALDIVKVGSVSVEVNVQDGNTLLIRTTVRLTLATLHTS